MADIKDIVPFIAVLSISLMIVATFYLVNENLKENVADAGAGTVYYTTTSYVATDQLNSSTNLTVNPGIKNWVCFNASGAAEAFAGTGVAVADAEVDIVINSLFPETASLVNATDRYDGVDINCSFNTTDFGAPIWKNLNKTGVAIGEYSDWVQIMALILAAAIVVGLVFGALVLRRAI